MTTTNSDQAGFDQARAESFGGQMVGVLNNAMTALGLSLGHRMGLFDAMNGLAPATSQAIAEAAGVNERYAREWLNAMTVSKVVGVRRGDGDVCAAGGARGIGYARGGSGERRVDDAVRGADGWGRERGRGGVPVGWRGAVFELRGFSPANGGEQRPSIRSELGGDADSAGGGDRAAAGGGDHGGGYGLWFRTCDQCDGAGVAEQSLHGLRLLRAGDWQCARGGGVAGAGERDVRTAGRVQAGRGEPVRLRDHVRRGARSGGSGGDAGVCGAGVEAGADLPLRGHCGVVLCAREHGPPAGVDWSTPCRCFTA